jgi:hypothetical protein
VRVPAGTRAALTWVGLAGIVAATVSFGPSTPFPGFAALLPVIAAGLVIAGGAGHARHAGAAVILGRQPLWLVGDLSYSFYLWHWPPLVIAAQYAGRPLSMFENILLLGIAFSVSYVTYRLYEDPLRHARRLRPPRPALALWPVTVSAVVLAVTVCAGAVATPGAAAPSLWTTGDEAAQQRPPGPKTVRQAVLESVAPSRLRQLVPDALAPPLGQLLHDTYRLGSCVASGTATSSKVCELGDTATRRRLVVFGDSHATMWMPGFLQFGLRYHWRVVPLIKPGCTPTVMRTGKCPAWYDWALGQVRRLHPQVVVLSQFWSSSEESGAAAIGRELRDLAPLTRQLIVLEDPPAHPRPTLDCLLARGATIGSCTFPVTPAEAATYASMRPQVRAAHARYLPTLQWFCARGLCPTIVGTIITYRDTTHITNTYASVLAEPQAIVLDRAIRG